MKKIVIYADGGSRGNPGPSGAGSVLFDEKGGVIAEIATYLGTTTNNVAEYTALVQGLEEAARINKKAAIEVRMDSELAIKQMQGIYKVKHPNLKPLFAEAQQLAKGFTKITYTHIPREKNSHADALANQAMDRGV